MRFKFFIAAAALLSFNVCAHADLIDSQTSGAAGTVTEYFGQQFTSSGNFTNISFSFYNNIPATTTVAAGTGFLLSQAYVGTPAALSSSTAGFLSSTAASGSAWGFGSSLQLTSGTYYFYENALITGSGGAAGEPAFFSPSGNAFTTAPIPSSSSFQSSNFIVTGTPISATPEPSSFVLLGTGLIVIGSALRRRVPHSSAVSLPVIGA
jgi:PEP-CTERM motif